jgi:hypothetical protein
MNNQISPSMEWEKDLEMAFRPADVDAAFVADLRARIIRAQKMPAVVRPTVPLKLAIGLAVFVLLVCGYLAIGPQRVIATIQSLFGYIPGIGYVNSNQGIRILANPVQDVRAGVTLIIERAVFDNTHSVVIFSVDNIPWNSRPEEKDMSSCSSNPQILLADGTRLDMTSGEAQGWGNGYRTRGIFAAVPPDQQEVSFLLPCLLDTNPGSAPEQWKVALQLTPAPTDLTVLPVLALPTLTSMSTKLPDATMTPTKNDDFGLRLQPEKIVELTNGYLIQGALLWDANQAAVPSLFTGDLTVTDANGRAVPSDPDFSNLGSGETPLPGRDSWALQIAGKGYASPLHLSLAQVEVHKPAHAEFDVDLGEHPQAGQVFPIHVTILLDGRKLVINTVTYPNGAAGETTLHFVIDCSDGIKQVEINNGMSSCIVGGGGGGGGGSESLGNDTLPTGTQHVVISGYYFSLTGPWRAEVALPNAGNTTSPTLSPLACLTRETWTGPKAQYSGSLPRGVRGTMLVEGSTPQGATLPELFTIAPDGTGKRILGIGGWAALSPDNRRMAFSSVDGLHLMELVVGSTSLLPWAGEDPYHPIFSPDGKHLAWIAVGSDPGVYFAQLDGGDKHKVPGTNAFTSLAGWMPDNLRIVVTQIGPDGARVRMINTIRGTAEDAFTINNAKGGFPNLSPDGKRIAFSERVIGSMSYEVFVSQLDGSEKKLIAAFDGGITNQATAWSPDDNWLVVTLGSNSDPNTYVQTSVILRPETCEFVTLPFEGSVVGWVW